MSSKRRRRQRLRGVALLVVGVLAAACGGEGDLVLNPTQRDAPSAGATAAAAGMSSAAAGGVSGSAGGTTSESGGAGQGAGAVAGAGGTTTNDGGEPSDAGERGTSEGTPCTGNADCVVEEEERFCHTSSGRCVECLTDAHCDGEACDQDEGKCAG